MDMRKDNMISGGVLLVFAAFYIYMTENLPIRNLPGTLGADFMPRIFGWILAVLAAVLIVQSYISYKKGQPMEEQIVVRQPLTRKEALKVAGLFALLVTYVYGIIYLGYLIATPLMLAILVYSGGSKKTLEIVLTSVVVSLLVFFLFNTVFMVPLRAIAFL
ncbi:MAG TPA: tripartite tricarboxylate transporter TctB family protein [Sediminispirochaeta sp.]|nr:tripartite tricarboxylate transporter TctB family protein [Sediminispirochaeta sp.]